MEPFEGHLRPGDHVLLRQETTWRGTSLRIVVQRPGQYETTMGLTPWMHERTNLIPRGNMVSLHAKVPGWVTYHLPHRTWPGYGMAHLPGSLLEPLSSRGGVGYALWHVSLLFVIHPLEAFADRHLRQPLLRVQLLEGRAVNGARLAPAYLLGGPKTDSITCPHELEYVVVAA